MNAMIRTNPTERRFGGRAIGLVAALALAIGTFAAAPAFAADRHGHGGGGSAAPLAARATAQ